MSAASAAYRETFRGLRGGARGDFLRSESRLPGPRGNLELLAVAVDVATSDELRSWAALTPEEAPGNTPGEFVATVGTAGLGRLVLEGDAAAAITLRHLANDPRWRVREGVAMALQRIGAADGAALLRIAREWADGDRYEQRAVVAGLAEPPLLRAQALVAAALDLFDAMTGTIAGAPDVRTDSFETLAKALAYGWSVVVAANAELGRPRMERWLVSDDPVIRRIMRANLSKARLERADRAWTARWRERLSR